MAARVLDSYVDDTGTKALADGESGHFAYAGVMIEQQFEMGTVCEIDTMSNGAFGTTDVELKSHWLRNPEQRHKHYLDPFGLSEEEFGRFSRDFFRMLVTLRIHCLGAVVHKDRLKGKYKKVVFDPSPLCYELLLQRVANYATQYKASRVNLYVDDMSGKNPRGSQWKDLLINQHRNLKAGRSPLYRTWTARPGMD